MTSEQRVRTILGALGDLDAVSQAGALVGLAVGILSQAGFHERQLLDVLKTAIDSSIELQKPGG